MTEPCINLSIVIPAFNEEVNLAATLEDIAAFLKSNPMDTELIIVDDGSTDATLKIAESRKNLFKNCTILKNEINRGKGYAVKRGMLSAKGLYALFMDADNATRIDQLHPLMDETVRGYDAVLASRRIKGAVVESRQPWFRILLGNTYILLSRLLLGAGVSDYNCGFKLFRTDTARLLFSKLTRDDWSFDSELIFLMRKLKVKSTSVPVRWNAKTSTSKVKPIRAGIRSFSSLLIIRVNDLRKVY